MRAFGGRRWRNTLGGCCSRRCRLCGWLRLIKTRRTVIVVIAVHLVEHVHAFFTSRVNRMNANPLIIRERCARCTIEHELLNIVIPMIDTSVENVASLRITIIAFRFALEVGLSVYNEQRKKEERDCMSDKLPFKHIATLTGLFTRKLLTHVSFISA